jgi:hypothetical protein
MLFQGVIRTAELYVADTSTNVYALDANTGAEVWRHFVGAQVNTLAVNDASLFIAGSGQLRAVSRQTGQTLWTVQTGSLLSGGPLVTDDRVMVVTQSGAVLVYDAATGTVIATSFAAWHHQCRARSQPGVVVCAFGQRNSRLSRHAVIERNPKRAPRRPGWDVFLAGRARLCRAYRSSAWQSRRRCPIAYRMCCATRCWGAAAASWLRGHGRRRSAPRRTDRPAIERADAGRADRLCVA